MKIKYLGTAAAEGWPALCCNCEICEHARKVRGKELRTRTQALINDDLVIDFPPDSYIHFMQNGIKFGDIQHMLITHSHMDHFFADDLIHRHEHFGHGAKGVLHIYGNEAVKENFDRVRNLDRFKSHPLDGVIEYHVVKPFEKFMAGDYEIMPILADHDKREQCLVYLISKDGQTLFYGHDTGVLMSDESWNMVNTYKIDLVSMDCTMGTKQIEGYHMGILDIPVFVQKLIDGGSVDEKTIKVINHFSHNGQMNHEELCSWAKAHGMLATHDGMEVEF